MRHLYEYFNTDEIIKLNHVDTKLLNLVKDAIETKNNVSLEKHISTVFKEIPKSMLDDCEDGSNDLMSENICAINDHIVFL